MGFRLLYLPYVVHRGVFQSMNLKDLICLALTSKRSFNRVKSHHRKSLELYIKNMTRVHWIEVHVVFKSVSRLTLNVARHTEKRLVNVNGNSVPLWRSRDGMFFHYEDSTVGLKNLVEFVQDLLGIATVVGAAVDKEGLWALDWVGSRQEILAEAEVIGRLTAEEYGNVLSSSNTKNLCIGATPPDDFRFSGVFKPREFCVIGDGNWITFDNFLAINSAVIKIEKSKLTTSAVNLILRAWISGDIPKTKWVHVNIEDFDYETVLEGLNLKVVENIKKQVVPGNFGYKDSFTSRFEIEQENGVKALIGYERRRFFSCIN